MVRAKSRTVSGRKVRSNVGKEHIPIDQQGAWDEKEQRRALHAHLVTTMHEFLDLSNVPLKGRIPIVAKITHRARQGVSRWFHQGTESGALPDVLSILLFAQALQADTNYLLGLTNRRRILPPLDEAPAPNHRDPSGGKSDADQVIQIAREMGELFPGNDCITMIGDEMEPLIKHATKMWIDKTVVDIQGNGIYALEVDGRTLVRIVEDRPGEGIILICENKRYREQSIATHPGSAASGVKVIGKIMGWFRAL